jgi:hypothetical protein
MANDKVSIWNQTIKLGRSPANGELLIGNGADFTLAGLTAGSNITITNSAGGISISSSNPGGTVTAVTASTPLSSSGGTAPNISLSGTVGVANGGTGAATLTANNIILGNGTSAVQFVAPGANGNVLTSNGTTWQSTPPSGTWTLAKKTSDQSLNVSSTTFQDVTQLSFSAAANATYSVRSLIYYTSPASGSGGGAIQCAFNGPASPTSITTQSGSLNVVTYDTQIQATSSQSFNSNGAIFVNFVIVNGANAGTVIIRAAQNTSGTAATVVKAGSYLEYTQIS